MSVSRRTLVRTVGLGSAGLSTSWFSGGVRDAAAFAGTAAVEAADDGVVIRLSNNENNRGPGSRAIAALHGAITSRMGRGYPPDSVNELTDTIAGIYGSRGHR